ncbi:alpha/beta fold hydrolase [Kribbella turkmenica]|nr:alpha/beta hydrolase [Kribbella turkmenica]
MTRTEESTITRVVSRDGTEIAYWTSGDGPPLVLVHGTTADHTRWAPVVKYLEPHVTVHAMDRRGRGGSGDAAVYDGVREFEDVAVVVDDVAETSGSAVDLLGHSFGGFCAFGAATLTSNIRKLVLYEGWPAPNPEALAIPPELQARMDALLSAGERERVLETFFREIVRMPDHEFDRYRSLPAWQARIAAAHTITREDRGHAERIFDPEEAKKITAPVLLMVGGDSPPAMQADYETVAAALPDARITVMDGQQHIAIDLIPEEFARRVLTFLH